MEKCLLAIHVSKVGMINRSWSLIWYSSLVVFSSDTAPGLAPILDNAIAALLR